MMPPRCFFLLVGVDGVPGRECAPDRDRGRELERPVPGRERDPFEDEALGGLDGTRRCDDDGRIKCPFQSGLSVELGVWGMTRLVLGVGAFFFSLGFLFARLNRCFNIRA